MKAILSCSILFFAAIFSYGQKINPNYDSTLAKNFGADDYGMKTYILVLLKTGSNTTENKILRDSLFAGHLKNIRRLVDQNKLIVAGPLVKNEKTYRGIFILNVKTFEEANALLETDPAVKEKLLDAELYQWYGSAALPDYLKASEKVAKFNF